MSAVIIPKNTPAITIVELCESADHYINLNKPIIVRTVPII